MGNACNVKIKWEDVLLLRKLYETGEHSPRELAEKFKLSQTYIYSLLHGEARQHERSRRPIAIQEPMLSRERIRDPHGNSFIPRVARVQRFKKQIPFRTVASIRYAVLQTGMTMSEASVKFGCSLSSVRRYVKKEARLAE